VEQKSIGEIKNLFACSNTDDLPALIDEYLSDERKGVQSAVKAARKTLEKIALERERIKTLMFFENKYSDCKLICGIDEVGRGPLAGPVCAGAVILDKEKEILYLNDSKKLSAQKRDELYDVIREKAVAVSTAFVESDRIDEINILNATYEAMRKAIKGLCVVPDILLNDYVHIPDVDIKQISITHGDAKSVSIAAASIVAKVTRDRLMDEYDKIYPGYGFAANKGYGTKEHTDAIRKMGVTPIHRLSFLKGILGE